MGVPLRRLPWLLAGFAALIAAAVTATDDRGAIRSTPAAAVEVPPLPAGSDVPGREGAESSAIALADALLAVPTGPDAGDVCPREDLQVSWKKPPSSYDHGAYLTPIGPAPDADTRRVNGIVVCQGSTYGFMGFEATWDGDLWSVFDVPFLAEEEGHGGGDEKGAPRLRLAAGLGDIRKDSPWYGRWGRDIEPLAPYEPQQVCDPGAKAGTLGFRALVFKAYPRTRNLGISRGCELGARSEHKEGRAWDWGVSVATPAERKGATRVISWLMATDEYGHSFAMARRLGLMYVIWDRHIWSSYAAGAGWRPYSGKSPHTDHVHLSFSRAGGLGLTSFWEGVDLDEFDVDAGEVSGFPLSFPTTFFLGGSAPPPAELGPGVKRAQALGPLPSRTGTSTRSQTGASGGDSGSSPGTPASGGTGGTGGLVDGVDGVVGGVGGTGGGGGGAGGGGGGTGGAGGGGGAGGTGGGGSGGGGTTLPTGPTSSSTSLLPIPLPSTSTSSSTTTRRSTTTTTRRRTSTTTTIKLPITTTTTIRITTTLPTLPGF